MKYCMYCGLILADEARFCSSCGKVQEDVITENINEEPRSSCARTGSRKMKLDSMQLDGVVCDNQIVSRVNSFTGSLGL